MSVPARTDPQKDQRPHVSEDQRLAYRIMAPQSAEFHHPTASLYTMQDGYQTTKNAHTGYIDIEPVTSNLPFGSWHEFKYGNEGWGLALAGEIWCKLPALRDSSDSYLAYGSPARADHGVNFAQYRPYIAEALMGVDDSEVFTQTLAQQKLREERAVAVHAVRALKQDAYTSERAIYNNGVKAVASEVGTDQWVVLPIKLPWNKDKFDYTRGCPLQAFGQEFRIRWKSPTLAQLIQTTDSISNVTTNTSANVTVPPEFFLRLHIVYTEREERAAQTAILQTDPGLSWISHHTAHEIPKTGITSAAQLVQIDLKNNQNSCAYMIVVVRHEDDLKAAGASTSAGVDTNLPIPRSASGTVVEAPDQFRFYPWTNYYITDTSAQRLTEIVNADQARTSLPLSHGRFFKSDPIHNMLVHSFGPHPAEEAVATGSMNFMIMNQPRLNIVLPSVPEGGTRRVDVMYVEYNFVHALMGHMYRTRAISP